MAQVVILAPVGGILLSKSSNPTQFQAIRKSLCVLRRDIQQMAVQSLDGGFGKGSDAVKVKEESDDQESHQESSGVVAGASWPKVEQEIEEEIKEEPEEDQEAHEKTPAKRRRLARKDMQGQEMSIKKEADLKVKEEPEVKVKEELGDGHEILPELGSMEAAAIWQQVKKEIKEEMQQEMGYAVIPDSAFAERVVKKEPKEEPDSTASCKRRRMTRKGQPSKKCIKEEVKVKKELGENSQKKSERTGAATTESDTLWLKVEKKIKQELLQEDAERSAGAASAGSATTKSHQFLEEGCLLNH